jgi:two-component system sensor histidine kinase BarA
MLTSKIKHHVWRLIFIPSLIMTLLLGGTLSYLYIAQISKFVDHRGGMLTLKTAQLSHYALLHGNEELVQSILDASLEEPFVRAVHLYHSSTGKEYHAGPTFYPALNDREADSHSPGKRHTVKSIRFSNPLVNNRGDESLGWVELELLTSPFLVLRLETLLITLIIIVLCLMLGGVLAIRLYENINLPLDHIKNTVRKLADGKFHLRINQQHSQEFSQLAEEINNLATAVETTLQEMQQHMDQQTDDLRENLETIEIQNIELDIARKQALEASRIKSEFLANTSHEIRTPLNGILGFTNLTLKTELDEQQREYLNTIRDSAQNLLTVINDILDFSKIEAGKLTLDYVPLPLRRVIEETLHLLAPDAHEKHIQLVTYIDPAIPAQLVGDPLRFKQIISNLINNAIKFSPKGNVILKVALQSRHKNQLVIKVSVFDQGPGLTQAQKDRLFKAFSQADSSTSREHGGTGLGLAICKGLVERMNGEIGVNSEQHKGSEFWFTARLGIDKNQPPTSGLNLEGKQVLLCGENIAVRTQLEQMLDLWQAQCHTINAIHDIFPALRTAQQSGNSYSLVILDIAPDERKIQHQLIHSLSEQLYEEFNCGVLVCATPAYQRLMRNNGEKGAASFISKPIAFEPLAQAISRMLDLNIRDPRPQIQLEVERPSANVLIVDDNPANLQLASELLRGLNTRVVQASSGQQALSICESEKFDIIFMDIQMPGMDGMETTRRLRASEIGKQRTPVIALTAHSLTEQKAELLIAGMDDCVSKPVSESQLAHIINRWAGVGGLKEVVAQSDRHQRVTQPNLAALQDTSQDTTSIDLALSLKLANNKPLLARDMLMMLVDGLRDEQSAINHAFEARDFTLLEERVHRLYGSCCYCGVPRMKRIAGLLDKTLQARQYDQVEGAIFSLNRAIDDVLAWAKDKDLRAIWEEQSH